jgi:mannose-1-phosphate guanylyltransferase
MHLTPTTQDFAGKGKTWAIVLAAGAGTRLRALTTNPAGIPVPKQFCSLSSGPSLLHQALQRAFGVVPRWRTSIVVAEQHAQWWGPLAEELPGSIAVQPDDRGTAIGILLALVRILERDPDARVVVLPSDHHVIDEHALTRALRNAIGALLTRHAEIVLLGVAPDGPDPELGYIAPAGLATSGLLGVAKFVEKPARALAAKLIAEGALWNTFIVVANGRELLELLRACEPSVVSDLRRCVLAGRSADGATPALRELYRHLPVLDFSRDVAQWNPGMFCALRAPACGWTDLGTVDRVRKALWQRPKTEAASTAGDSSALSLAHALGAERLPGQAGRDLPDQLGVRAVEMMPAR